MTGALTGRPLYRWAALLLAVLTLVVQATTVADSRTLVRAAPTTTLTFLGTGDPSWMRPVIAAFETRNPDITVKYQTVPFDQLNDVITSRLGSSDKSIDVFWADQSRTASYAARGDLLNLTSQVSTQELSSLIPSTVKGSSWNGKLWSMPIWTSEQVMYYNADLLKKAGIIPPTTNPAQRWTWEHVLTAAKKTQAVGAKWGLMWDQVDRYYQLQPLPESAGGGSGATGADLLTPSVANAGWLKAMRFYSQVFKSGVGPRGISADQSPDLFANGQAAFWVGGPWWLGKFLAVKNLHFGIAAHPYFAGGKPATPTDSWSWGINPYSQNKAAAIRFVKFASLTTQGNLATVKILTQPPANAAASSQLLSTLSAASPALHNLKALLTYELAHTAVHRPPSVGYIEMEAIMGRAFSDIRNGADVATVLQHTSTQLSAAWSRLK